MPECSIRSLAMLLLAAASVAAGAQQAAPDAHSAHPSSTYSRVDLYGGYAFLAPTSSVEGFNYQRINTGAVTSASVYFGKHAGAQVEGGFHPSGYEALKNPYLVAGSDCVYTAQAGPVFRLPGKHLVPFVHVLGGAAKVGGPRFQPCTWGVGLTAGGGLDYLLPMWNNRLSARVFQLDYEYMHVDFGAPNPYGLAGGKADIHAFRASAGVVLHLGDAASLPRTTFACTATPSDIYVGAWINVTAALDNAPAQEVIRYEWTSSSGPIGANAADINVATKGLTAGSYSITAHAFAGTRKKEIASCSASFNVKPIEPPTIVCSAGPTTVAPGDSSTITSIALSPAHRPLTYSYAASAGQISGKTSTAQLTAAGVAPGVITVICAVVDDTGQRATFPANVTVASPAMPPTPAPQALCSLSFARDKKRPVRVDNEARACLDDVALTLQHQPEAMLTVVGEHGADESATFAAERAVNIKAYLTEEKGLDAARIEVRSGNRMGKTAENYLLQPGTFEHVRTTSAANVPASKQAYSTAASYAAAKAKKHPTTARIKPSPQKKRVAPKPMVKTIAQNTPSR